MRNIFLSLSLFCIAAVPAALRADQVSFTLDPVTGTIAGAPGQTIGWGFTFVNDTANWITVTSSDLENETDPALGTYSDFIAAQGGNAGLFDIGIAPFTTWTEIYDGVSQGAGSYAINASATAPSSDQGLFSVYFDFYDGDPGNGGNYLSSSSVQTSFEVDTVPEPGTWFLLGGAFAALGVLFVWRRRRIVSH